LPPDLTARLDLDDLHAKVNYYGPAMAALSLGSPLYRGGLWTIRGRVGKSIRTHRRSVVAPALEPHLEEQGRLEFKLFEMSCSITDFHGYFLLWLCLLLDDALAGRASRQTRVYDLGQVARLGLEAETVRDRAYEILDSAPRALEPWGFDTAALEPFRKRLATGWLPADRIIALFHEYQRVPDVLRHLTTLTRGTVSQRVEVAAEPLAVGGADSKPADPVAAECVQE